MTLDEPKRRRFSGLPKIEEPGMGKYLLKVSYTPEGIRGLMKEGGTGRVSSVEKALAGVGGSLDTLYFAFGSSDVYAIADVPDNATAMAIGTAIAASGAISSYETVVLLSPAEVDAAMQTSISYRPPGS
jgi:uncharacterized protein with GYD domain